MQNPRYSLHRAALHPLLGKANINLPAETQAAINTVGEENFLAFLHQHRLQPLWDQHLGILTHTNFSDLFRQQLKQSRIDATAHYLQQKNALATIRTALDDAGIQHAVFKGADIREKIYAEPALRVADDIDLLINENHIRPTLEIFQQLGFKNHLAPNNISHELSLFKQRLNIDLHWHILRPGRTRTPLTEELLAGRRDYGTFWGLAPTATLAIMLVHPVITKYCTAPQASINRVLDIALWLNKQEIAWPELLELLTRMGLKTAAWVMLRYVTMLTDIQPPQEVTAALAPGKLRRGYLNRWLTQDYASRLQGVPLAAPLGFTLPIHDSPKDAARAIASLTRESSLKNKRTEELKKGVNGKGQSA